jgi:hypothetical protein
MDQLFTKNIKKFFVVLVLIFLIWLFFMSFHNSFVKDSVEIYKHLWVIPLLLSLILAGICVRYILELY